MRSFLPLLMPILLLAGGCSLLPWGGETGATEWVGGEERRLSILEVLEGEWAEDHLLFAKEPRPGAITVTGADIHARTLLTESPYDGMRMVLAFQLAEGKTPADFREFKEIDLPWIAENNGRNHATVWTERSPQWPFDAFEDVTFQTREDFTTAYAGNEELAEAAEGLFGDPVLVLIVTERTPTP